MIDRIEVQSIPSTTMSSSVREENNENKTTEPIKSSTEHSSENSDPKKKLDKVVKSMNDFASASKTHLKFQLHDKLNEYYVSIIDDNTQEVIKEIPSKKLLDMFAAMSDFLGLMVDKKI